MTLSYVDSSDTPRPPDSKVDDLEMGGEEVEQSDTDKGTTTTDMVVEGSKGTEEGATEGTAGQVPGTRSWVWDYFKTVTEPNGGKKNICTLCKKPMSYQQCGTTSHMKRHLEKYCAFRAKINPQQFTDKVQTQLHTTVKEDGECSVATFVFSFDRVKTLAGHMCLAHEYSFNMVEHKVFNEFLKAYSPYYKKISRYQVRKECFLYYEQEKERIKGLLGKINRVSLTTDCWSCGPQRIGYMVITCHFIDRNWNLQKRVLSFVNVPPLTMVLH